MHVLDWIERVIITAIEDDLEIEGTSAPHLLSQLDWLRDQLGMPCSSRCEIGNNWPAAEVIVFAEIAPRLRALRQRELHV